MPDIEIYRVDTHQLTPGEYETLSKILVGFAPITRADPHDPRVLKVHWPSGNGSIKDVSPLMRKCRISHLLV